MATQHKSLLRALVILTVFLILLAVLFTPSSQDGPEDADGATMRVLEAPLAADGESTCSDRATARGPGQRVVSFTFFGDMSQRYYSGIEGNAETVQKFYPGWTMRVYHEIPENDIVWHNLSSLLEQYPHLDLCNISDLPAHESLHGSERNMWRFLPMVDPLVEVFVSRDLDARTMPRERTAVAEWLASNLTFHLMRDHPSHRVEMLGGMWGVKVGDDRELLKEFWSQIKEEGVKAGHKSHDQIYLKDIVWPELTGKVMQHDSYYCKEKQKAEKGNMRPFSVKRIHEAYNFIGFRTTVGKDKRPLSKECPKECRPPDHLDWKTC